MPSPFFWPGGVVLTNSSTGATSFFSFSFFSFLAPEAAAVGTTALTACLASFSNRLASFLAACELVTQSRVIA